MTTPVRTRPTRPLSIKGRTIAAIFTVVFFVFTHTADGFAIGAADVDVEFKPVAIDDHKSALRVQYEHLRRVAVTAQCSLPRERVIHMKDLITDPSVRFIPECTTLHRCAGDTGCCPAGHVCAPRKVDEVTLVFQVFRMNPSGPPQITTEAFQFSNHTMCGCDKENDIPK